MDVIAKSQVRVAPRKVRLVADAVRNLSLYEALDGLANVKNRGASVILKTLQSAVANATNNNKLNKDALSIKSIDVLEAPSYKRFHPSTRGRVHPYKRRGSNITIVLTDNVKSETNAKLMEKVEEVMEEKKETKVKKIKETKKESK